MQYLSLSHCNSGCVVCTMAVLPSIHTQHIDTLCGRIVEFRMLKLAIHTITARLQKGNTCVTFTQNWQNSNVNTARPVRAAKHFYAFG
jgi:hypothetical protein